MIATPDAVLDFWFGAPGPAADVAARQRTLWFGKSAANDQIVIERFADTLVAAGKGELDHWADTPRGRLALIVVLDQFPHHIHRDHGQSFATTRERWRLPGDDPGAARMRISRRSNGCFSICRWNTPNRCAMQDQSVALYEKLAMKRAADERALFDDFLDYARKHRDVVARFGRFPHRNAILGRPSTADELEFLKQPGSRF